MEMDTIEAVRKTLEKEYLLIKKGKLWSFLGGLVGFLVVAGFVSYQATLKAVETTGVIATIKSIDEMAADANATIQSINKLEAQAKKGVSQIEKMRSKYSDELDRIDRISQDLQTVKNGFSDQLSTLRSDLSYGKLPVLKAVMLKARDDQHWFRFKEIDRSNHDVFELWRETDETYHPTIRVEAAAKLRARDDEHWLVFYQLTRQNHDLFRLWKYDNTWHSTIKITFAEQIN